MVLLAQAAEEDKMREPDEQLQRDNHIAALTAAGFEEPEKLLERLRDLSERVRISLDELVRTVVKLKAAPEHTEELDQNVDRLWKLRYQTYGPITADNLVVMRDPMPLVEQAQAYITPFQVIGSNWNGDIPPMPGPPERSKNKRGQRSQQKPWHPKFRRIS